VNPSTAQLIADLEAMIKRNDPEERERFNGRFRRRRLTDSQSTSGNKQQPPASLSKVKPEREH